MRGSSPIFFPHGRRIEFKAGREKTTGPANSLAERAGAAEARLKKWTVNLELEGRIITVVGIERAQPRPACANLYSFC